MSFIGAINDKCRKFFATHAALLEGRDVFIGCSGNFSLEQILTTRAASARLYSNDISLYSSVLGHLLAGQPFHLACTDPELHWLNAYLERGAVEQMAVLVMLTSMLQFRKCGNPYQQRMWTHYLANFDRYFDATCDKIRKVAGRVRVVEYTMTDVHDYYPRPGAVSVSFFPTYVGGYERLFKKLDAAFDWDRPRYEVLTAERREATIRRMAEGDFILYDDNARDDFTCVATISSGGRKNVHVYSNLPFPGCLVRLRINEKAPKYDLLMPEEEIAVDSVVALVKADMATINHYRNMFLSKKIVPGSGSHCFLLLADNRVFGVLMFLTYSVKLKRPDEVYLMSDFVVPSTRHPRLAKLALLLSLTADMREIMEKAEIKRYRTVLTSVFTDKPVSMKYRGIYDLAKRSDGFLNYRGTFAVTTLQEALAQWKKKYDTPEKPRQGSTKS
jgi:hypothetical protein